MFAYGGLIVLCFLVAGAFVAALKPGEIGGFALLPLFVPAYPWIKLFSADAAGESAWLYPASSSSATVSTSAASTLQASL
jgi:hypothetical protein